MVFKKPYAFFIKYFKVINLVLSLLFVFLSYRLNIIRKVVNQIYLGKLTNYSSLRSTYVGLGMYFYILLLIGILALIVLLLYRKKKPLYDYLYAIIYLVFVFVYLMAMSNLFLTLDETIVEQTTLKTYTDISFLIIVPIAYFLVKYIMITIGFSLSKFNFTKDIMELKQEEKDSEEVELVFDKNTYKYKRGIRRSIRELKYYFLENKFLIYLILGIVIIISFISIFSVNMFKTNKVKFNSNFNAGNFNYKVNNVYETKYDLNHTIINNENKYVIANVNVRNITSESKPIDLKRIRVIYNGNKYSYATTYFNKYFYDLGTPYNNEPLITGNTYNYIFIFKVPKTAKNYTLKFYDRVTMENDEIKGTYKEVGVNVKPLDKKREEKQLNVNENTIFNKKSYGESNITINNYEVSTNYVYKKDNINNVIRSKDANKVLLILDYNLVLDTKSSISTYFKDDKEFFNKFTSITYEYGTKEKNVTKINVEGIVDNKVMISVPYDVLNASSIKFNIELRDIRLIYTLK